MRMLVLGGTVFLSHAVAATAVSHGHEVTCAARGRSGAVSDGARLVPVDRDAPDALEPLAGTAFDAVVDVARMSPRWVREALAVLGPGAGHWTFVSSISAYADHRVPRQGIDAPLLAPGEDDYGAAKVASEHAVGDALGDRAFVVRAGLIVGPGDVTDRFGYWPARFARGGRAVVPDVPDQPIQHVDVRDLAAWIVDAGERRLTGTFDGIGPVTPLPKLLAGIADAVGAPGLERLAVPPPVLAEAGVAPWSGPRSLPLWLPADHHGMTAHDPAPALAAGLRPRPLADTAAAALAHERALGLDRSRAAGLSAAEEARVLAAWQAAR